MDVTKFNSQSLVAGNPLIFDVACECRSLSELRGRLTKLFGELELEAARNSADQSSSALARIRDCGLVLRNMLKERSDQMAGFSVGQAIFDIAHGHAREDLSPGFYADICKIFKGLQGRGSSVALEDVYIKPRDDLAGREAAIERSEQLGHLCTEVDLHMARFVTGLRDEVVLRRKERREYVSHILGASDEEWADWRWQATNVVKDVNLLKRLVTLTDDQFEAISLAKLHSLPFGVTPYYLSLMDNDPGEGRDAAIRAQVFPPIDYVNHVARTPGASLDFMREEDTSPFDLITRRYPAICILKPFNTCPQICVYCQRNWEIDDAMASGAFAGMDQVEAALEWIREHPGIREVLVTGGDPLAMGDGAIEDILARVSSIPTVERIRIGTRTPVTMPMRLTDKLADIISRHRIPGRREVSVVTHVQHPYEITPELVEAVDKLRMRGISVYNQLVYTYYISRRFEASALRRQLRLVGIDPYYTFNTKGKEETLAYRVPIARLLQEQQEEARLLPGLERTDEAVFNLPRLGKNYLKSSMHRDLLSILPDGSRVYEMYSWEKNISSSTRTHCTHDVPIFDYLCKLEKSGENVAEYDTIWFYF